MVAGRLQRLVLAVGQRGAPVVRDRLGPVTGSPALDGNRYARVPRLEHLPDGPDRRGTGNGQFRRCCVDRHQDQQGAKEPPAVFGHGGVRVVRRSVGRRPAGAFV